MKIEDKMYINKISYYIFITLLMIYYSFRKANINYENFDIALLLSIPFFIIKFISETYTLKELIINTILIALGVISTLLISNTSILIAFCIIIGMKNINYKTLLKLVFFIRLFTTILLLISVGLGYVSNYSVMRNNDVVRNSLGYTHPNTFGIYCFVLISLWFILYGDKNWKLKALIAMIINFIQFIFTNSRTSFLLIFLYILLIVFTNSFRKVNFIKKFSCISMSVCFLINILITFMLNNKIGQIANQLLSSRVTLSESFLRVYGIKIFGQKIANYTTEEFYWHLDSGYLNLFIQFGLIIGLIYLVLSFIMAKTIKSNNIYIYIAIILFAMYGVIEDVLSSFLFNYLWIVMGYSYYKYLNRKRNIKISKLSDLKNNKFLEKFICNVNMEK